MYFIKKSLVACIIFILASDIVLSQSIISLTNVADSIPVKDSVIYNPLLILPFNPKFYISDADREITASCKITFNELKERFRNGLITKLHYRISDLEHTFPLVTYSDTTNELSKIYASTTCRLEELTDPPKENKKNLFSNVKKKETKTVVRNGQLGAKEESALKFMNLVVLNNELFPYLSKKYGTSLFVFINQFEIINDLSDYAAISDGHYNRQIRVHYSVFNSDGLVYGGLATNIFPASENNVQEIINAYFPPICETIFSHIPPIRTHVLSVPKEKIK